MLTRRCLFSEGTLLVVHGHHTRLDPRSSPLVPFPRRAPLEGSPPLTRTSFPPSRALSDAVRALSVLRDGSSRGAHTTSQPRRRSALGLTPRPLQDPRAAPFIPLLPHRPPFFSLVPPPSSTPFRPSTRLHALVENTPHDLLRSRARSCPAPLISRRPTRLQPAVTRTAHHYKQLQEARPNHGCRLLLVSHSDARRPLPRRGSILPRVVRPRRTSTGLAPTRSLDPPPRPCSRSDAGAGGGLRAGRKGWGDIDAPRSLRRSARLGHPQAAGSRWAAARVKVRRSGHSARDCLPLTKLPVNADCRRRSSASAVLPPASERVALRLAQRAVTKLQNGPEIGPRWASHRAKSRRS